MSTKRRRTAQDSGESSDDGEVDQQLSMRSVEIQRAFQRVNSRKRIDGRQPREPAIPPSPSPSPSPSSPSRSACPSTTHLAHTSHDRQQRSGVFHRWVQQASQSQHMRSALRKARPQDPLAVLPTDIGVYIMEFLETRQVARLRALSKEWRRVGNARLANVRVFNMDVDKNMWVGLSDERQSSARDLRRSAVLFVVKRCGGLRSLVFTMYGDAGYSAGEVESVLSACNRMSSLFLFAGQYAVSCHHAARFPAAPLAPLVAAGHFRTLVVLTMQLRVTDADAQVMAGHHPSLRALHIIASAYSMIYEHPLPLTSRGVSTLINGAPSLTVLLLERCASLIDPVPSCHSSIRMLGLVDGDVSNTALQSLLTHVGPNLRTLDLSPRLSDPNLGHHIPSLTDPIVQHIANLCPQLQSLKVSVLLTSACLPSLAQMASLRQVFFREVWGGDSIDTDWLRHHTTSRSLVVRGGREPVSESEVCDFFSFPAMVIADQVPVDKEEWGQVSRRYLYEYACFFQQDPIRRGRPENR